MPNCQTIIGDLLVSQPISNNFGTGKIHVYDNVEIYISL